MRESLRTLEGSIGHAFSDPGLLQRALTHSSYANENRASGCECNERLEFLGDSILGLCTADHLYRTFPQMPEGQMTRLRAELVCESSLYQTASALQLGKYLLLGKGEESNGGRDRESILSDAVEALIAAIYLDAGMEAAAGFVFEHILSKRTIRPETVSADYKTALQEIVQREGGQTLSYRLIGEEGPDHAKIFRMQACLNDRPIGTGEGRSKKEAEQIAAKNALEVLKP
jgi:ribonuclease-3